MATEPTDFKPTRRLKLAEAQVVVIDMQEKMLAHIADNSAVVGQASRMIRAARALGIPVTVSEQYVRGLGPTVPEINAALECDGAAVAGAGAGAADGPADCARHEKMTFSLMGDPAVRERISLLMRPQIVLVGVETHVCVLQTALDLLDLRLQPIVLADAVGSRRLADRDCALERMRHAGAAIATVESVIFELVERAGTELFKRILPLVK